MRQFQCVPTAYVTGIKEAFSEIYTKKYHVHWLYSFNISNCQSVLKYLSLYGKLFIFTWQLYITKFDFMKYAFAKLVVAW